MSLGRRAPARSSRSKKRSPASTSWNSGATRPCAASAVPPPGRVQNDVVEQRAQGPGRDLHGAVIHTLGLGARLTVTRARPSTARATCSTSAGGLGCAGAAPERGCRPRPRLERVAADRRNRRGARRPGRGPRRVDAPPGPAGRRPPGSGMTTVRRRRVVQAEGIVLAHGSVPDRPAFDLQPGKSPVTDRQAGRARQLLPVAGSSGRARNNSCRRDRGSAAAPPAAASARCRAARDIHRSWNSSAGPIVAWRGNVCRTSRRQGGALTASTKVAPVNSCGSGTSVVRTPLRCARSGTATALRSGRPSPTSRLRSSSISGRKLPARS